MSQYQLAIVTPSGKIFDAPVTSLKAPGASGSFGVLTGHAPMVVSLRSGPLTINKGGEEFFYRISPGVLEVNIQSTVLVLTDSATLAKTYEEAKVPVASGLYKNLN